MEIASATSASQDASQLALIKSLKARVVTTAIGFRIGPLGVEYSSKRVEIDPKTSSSDQEPESNARQAFEQTQVRQDALEAAQLDDTAAKAQNHPDPTWRKGLAAYAKAQSMGRGGGCGELRSVLAVA